jgi:MFS family permease
MGKAFGLHKALDMLGSALGILLTFFLLRYLSVAEDFDYKRLFAVSIIPAILGLLMFFFVKQKKNPAPPKEREPFWRNVKAIDGQLKLYLLVVFIFTLGNSSNAFILLKAKEAGFDDVNVILLYFLYTIVASILSLPLGRLSDKIGRKNLLVPGYLAFALCYFGFAFASGRILMVAVFVLYGVYTAMIMGVERAFVAEISPPHLKGTMLGLHSTLAGIALLPASIFAGLLWGAFGAEAPFIFGASLSLVAAGVLILFMRNKSP